MVASLIYMFLFFLHSGYDFAAVLEWFAERVDRIILLFDAHKLDISDEFSEVIKALKNHEDKIRCRMEALASKKHVHVAVLSKQHCGVVFQGCAEQSRSDRDPAADESVRCPDVVSGEDRQHPRGKENRGCVSGRPSSPFWGLGVKSFCPFQVIRVYIGSFWSHPLLIPDNRKLFEAEEQDLFKDIQSLPRNAALRKLNDLIKRARLAKVGWGRTSRNTSRACSLLLHTC